MPFVYSEPPTSGPLRQGEILADIWEHRPLPAPVEIPKDQQGNVPVQSIRHLLMIVMTAVCDLEWDYAIRFPKGTDSGESEAAIQSSASQSLEQEHPTLVPHVLLCEVYEEGTIRHRVPGTDVWKRISHNQDERYHQFHSAFIGEPPVDVLPDQYLDSKKNLALPTESLYVDVLPDLYLDFKKTLALPTESLYMGLRIGGVRRVAVVPPIHIHDLMHRFYGFLSRVGLPD